MSKIRNQSITPVNLYVNFFESLSVQTPYETYENIFTEEVYFEDPFQKTTGVKDLHNVFMHMFETLYKPRFVVEEVVEQENIAYLRWSFFFQRSPKHETQSFIGVSRVTFSASGKVMTHIDYWDAASHVYSKIPILKNILNAIKNRIKAT